ncbi:bacillithiol biosynthesis deacetylase BshB1 [Pseudalkalibacillus berkeleyi]|uniref:Bacillithiol biosynthesis deacetylase BshB1 n=1 Tax=Pseudalkalibacillus berkeleyi TaxID=1069813 RepID=A0ABS9H0Y3_9BACL|nr:bacillithiol biosynthesis deacetylase BshB1 [Pseudalkalibacillus berkeleyi]MCF6137556.1 bacillithiol biosynthesis deacetylase BshB1 [Pseudalkalibacillus berkeleyi]
MTQRLDILAFGAHPDDVEIGMAGTLIQQADKGLKTGICDLTLAELSSNGNVELRQAEAKEATEVLNLTERMNLQLPDRGLMMTEEYIQQIATVIRQYKPKVVFIPYPKDRHPDHGNCTRLVEEAIFSAGIRKYTVPGDLPSHRVNKVYYYFINGYDHPPIVSDITPVKERKMKSLSAYKSQFMSLEGGVDTPLNNGYLETVEARDALFGKEAGVRYAEGFYMKGPLLMENWIGE